MDYYLHTERLYLSRDSRLPVVWTQLKLSTRLSVIATQMFVMYKKYNINTFEYFTATLPSVDLSNSAALFDGTDFYLTYLWDDF